ncbi:hypothetical protein [Lysinibacillus xylanilyticus]|uniref:hypothetical protein n=1 Tax=Lysinibacillus xylanilyticus TaxID=582475 RepID=UPI0036DDE1CF
MAGRRGQKVAVKNGVDSSMMVYVSMAIVLAALSLALYTFGIDFGFVHFGGSPNVNVLYGGAVACIILSYIVDIMYVKAIKRFYRQKDSFLTYIPYVNFIGIFSKTPIIISWVLVGLSLLIVVPAFTPIGQFMPVDYLVLMSTKSIYILLGCMVVFSIIRGYYCFYFKKQVETTYRREISENHGSGGNLTFVGYIIYFLPIIRAISLFTDLNFINTVKSDLDDMYRGEER